MRWYLDGFFLGIMFKGDVWKLGKGGVVKGLIIFLVVYFLFNLVLIKLGWFIVFLRLGDL